MIHVIIMKSAMRAYVGDFSIHEVLAPMQIFYDATRISYQGRDNRFHLWKDKDNGTPEDVVALTLEGLIPFEPVDDVENLQRIQKMRKAYEHWRTLPLS